MGRDYKIAFQALKSLSDVMPSLNPDQSQLYHAAALLAAYADDTFGSVQ